MFLPPLIFAGFAGMAWWGMQRGGGEELPSTMIGLAAPGIRAAPLGDHATFSAADLAGGGLKLVNFWASWCPPCRAEHPNLEALSAHLPIYGVNKDDRDGNALAFLAELGNPYVALTNDDTRQSIDWGVYGLPETFLLDGDGTILHRVAGPLTRRVIESDLEPILRRNGVRISLPGREE